jgi:transposase
MLMDLEQRRVVDLLPVRTAASFADWLRKHPGVEIIARDRCGLYAEGGREGAPAAVQVTDRYHLMSNLWEAVEHTLQQLQIDARAQLGQETSPKPSQRLTLVEARYQRCREARYERYRAVIELSRQGCTQLQIAERVGVGPGTVARWQNAGGFPERRIRRDRRRDQACFLQDRDCGLHPALARTHFSSARMTALLLTPPRDLSATQLRYRDSFLRFCPTAYKVRKLALQFRAMLRWRRSARLGEWIEAVVGSWFPVMVQFARTLRRDLGAVELAITAPWSNGPMEGHINRLKMIKRQMYGPCRLRAAEGAGPPSVSLSPRRSLDKLKAREVSGELFPPPTIHQHGASAWKGRGFRDDRTEWLRGGCLRDALVPSQRNR